MMQRDIDLQQPPPCAADMPSKEEVFASIRYDHVLKKQKFESNVLLPDDEVVDSEMDLFQRLSKISAQNAAPAWFGPAIQQAIGPAIQQAIGPAIQQVLGPAIQQALVPLVTEIRDLRSDIAVVNNRSGALPNHPIMPRPRPPELEPAPLPQAFPTTMRELREISGPRCSVCLEFYGLHDHGSVTEKRQRLADYLGAQHA